MASGGVLPTYQRYQNGSVIPQRRTTTLRMREKYIVLLVFVTFAVFCFGTFMFLPDLRDRVSVDHIKRQLGQDMFIPKGESNGGGKVFRHHPNELVDQHQIIDKEELDKKIKMDNAEVLEKQRQQLDIPADAHDQLRQDIAEDKKKLEVKQKDEELKKREDDHIKALNVVEDHPKEAIQLEKPKSLVDENSDQVNLERRAKIKEVQLSGLK